MIYAADKVPDEWRQLLGLLPGYDPFAQAGDCVFDVEAAQLVIAFFPEVLRHAKGAMGGKPFALEPWQQALAANLFGWKRPDGTRRYRTVFLYVPKKNGKTAFAAGLMIFAMTADREFGAECYSAAASRDQATLIFSHMAGMIRQDKDLKDRYRVYGTVAGGGFKSITDEARGISYKCLASDAGTVDGVNVHVAVIDELHRHKNAELASVLERSTSARKQPIVIFTTTADSDRESVCNSKLDYAKRVRDNAVQDPEMLPAIWEAAVEDDWTSPEVWRRVNPNFGVTIQEEYFHRQVTLCKEQPSELSEFLRLHLNVRTKSQTQWLNLVCWREGSAAQDPVEWRRAALDALKGKPCFAGLDLGISWDFTALALYWPPDCEDGRATVIPWFWIPAEGGWKNDKANANLYDDWIRRGFVTVQPGNCVNHAAVRADILRIAETHPVQMLAADPWNAIQLINELSGDGMQCVQMRQGFISMNAPSKELERLVTSGRLEHGKNPVLDWMVSAAEIASDPAGNIKPVKPGKNSPLKIDGVVASIMAIGCSLAAQIKTGSVYDDTSRELLTVML